MFMPAKRKRPKMQAPKIDSPIRCPSFLQHIRGYNCACVENDPTGCGGKIQAAHVRRGADGGIGSKPGDNFAIPLCEQHHRDQHNIGEQSFEKRHGFKMLHVADRLWRRWITTTEAGKKFEATRRLSASTNSSEIDPAPSPGVQTISGACHNGGSSPSVLHKHSDNPTPTETNSNE